MSFTIRPATDADCPTLAALISLSVRKLQAETYTPLQIEGALGSVFGVDSRLIRDGTYFVAENSSGIIGCGGWSWRKTLFGGDHSPVKDDESLDPRTDPAKVRAFFVHPDWTRIGVGRRILEACEQAASQMGFTRVELASTLAGIPLYRACGFVEVEPFLVPLANGEKLPVVRMSKPIGPTGISPSRAQT